MMQPPVKQIDPIATATSDATMTNQTQSATKQQLWHRESKQRMSETAIPRHSAIQALVDINAAGVALLQTGYHAEALVWFQRGLAVYGIDLTQFGIPNFSTYQQQQQEATPTELQLDTTPSSSLLRSIDLSSVQSASTMEQDHATPYELYSNALLVKSDGPNSNGEAQYLMPAVLLYNTGLLVHLHATVTQDHFTAHELYRWSLFFIEEAILHKRSKQQYLHSDLLLLALFNNLCQLNSLFYLPERVALCREKLIQVLAHSHPAHVSPQDHAFFYEQLIFSANLFPAAAPAA